MSESLQNLADNLRMMRKRKGWTQVELSEKSTVAFNTIKSIECQSGSPAWATIEMLAKVLEVKAHSLMIAPRKREEGAR